MVAAVKMAKKLRDVHYGAPKDVDETEFKEYLGHVSCSKDLDPTVSLQLKAHCELNRIDFPLCTACFMKRMIYSSCRERLMQDSKGIKLSK